MKVAVIGGRDPVLGFALAGVKEQFPAETGVEAEAALNRCLDDPDIGIILIEERYTDQISSTRNALKKSKKTYPIILPIPGSG